MPPAVFVRRLNGGRDGWIRASYLSAEEPLRARLAQRDADVARLQQEVSGLMAQLRAERTPAPAPGSDAARGAPAGAAPAGEDPAALSLCAQEDLIDILTADTLVNFTEEPRGDSRGARHCEFGIGLALNKKLVIIGPREHAFHFLPQVRCFASWADFLGSWLIKE